MLTLLDRTKRKHQHHSNILICTLKAAGSKHVMDADCGLSALIRNEQHQFSYMYTSAISQFGNPTPT
jgi:hypothetical protein